MTAKPINERRRAKQDVQDAVDHYLAQGAPGAAHTFLQALEAAYLLISAHPSSGSPNYVERFGGPSGLRGWALKGFPMSSSIWRALIASTSCACFMGDATSLC